MLHVSTWVAIIGHYKSTPWGRVIAKGKVGTRKGSYSVHGVISGVCKGVNFVGGVWKNLNCIFLTKVVGEDER